MKDYSKFPPEKYFIKTLKHCPRSAWLYVQLWQKKSKDKIFIRKNNVRREYLISPTVFRHLLDPLVLLNLITFSDSDEDFQISIRVKHEKET